MGRDKRKREPISVSTRDKREREPVKLIIVDLKILFFFVKGHDERDISEKKVNFYLQKPSNNYRLKDLFFVFLQSNANGSKERHE